MLMYGEDQHNIVKQLPSNKKGKKQTEISGLHQSFWFSNVGCAVIISNKFPGGAEVVWVPCFEKYSF